MSNHRDGFSAASAADFANKVNEKNNLAVACLNAASAADFANIINP